VHKDFSIAFLWKCWVVVSDGFGHEPVIVLKCHKIQEHSIFNNFVRDRYLSTYLLVACEI